MERGDLMETKNTGKDDFSSVEEQAVLAEATTDDFLMESEENYLEENLEEELIATSETDEDIEENIEKAETNAEPEQNVVDNVDYLNIEEKIFLLKYFGFTMRDIAAILKLNHARVQRIALSFSDSENAVMLHEIEKKILLDIINMAMDAIKMMTKEIEKANLIISQMLRTEERILTDLESREVTAEVAEYINKKYNEIPELLDGGFETMMTKCHAVLDKYSEYPEEKAKQMNKWIIARFTDVIYRLAHDEKKLEAYVREFLDKKYPIKAKEKPRMSKEEFKDILRQMYYDLDDDDENENVVEDVKAIKAEEKQEVKEGENTEEKKAKGIFAMLRKK